MKRQRDLIQLALLGVAAAGLTTMQPLAAQTLRGEETPGYSYNQSATFDNDLTPAQQQFYSTLSPDAQMMFCEGCGCTYSDGCNIHPVDMQRPSKS